VGRKDPLFKDLKEIALAVESASDLISKLLLFGRKQPMTLIPLNINDTINNSLKILKRLIGEDMMGEVSSR
jgi:hypothetical protein